MYDNQIINRIRGIAADRSFAFYEERSAIYARRDLMKIEHVVILDKKSRNT